MDALVAAPLDVALTNQMQKGTNNMQPGTHFCPLHLPKLRVLGLVRKKLHDPDHIEP